MNLGFKYYEIELWLINMQAVQCSPLQKGQYISYMDFDLLVTKIAHEIAFTRSSLASIQEISSVWVANRDTIKCGRYW
jgi:hypothetical protein